MFLSAYTNHHYWLLEDVNKHKLCVKVNYGAAKMMVHEAEPVSVGNEMGSFALNHKCLLCRALQFMGKLLNEMCLRKRDVLSVCHFTSKMLSVVYDTGL